MRRTGLNNVSLKRLYSDLGKSDMEIANFFDCARTTIVKLRKKYNIETRKSIGVYGEDLVSVTLKKKGFRVKNMNEEDATYLFDLLINEKLRIEVKTSITHEQSNGCKYWFMFSEKKESGCVESEYKIILPNGRLRKDFRKTCDFLILVGLGRACESEFFIIPSNEIPKNTTGLTIDKENPGKYSQFKDAWHLIKKPDAPTSDN